MRQLIGLSLVLIFVSSCASYEKFRKVTEEYELPSQVYNADFNQTWQAVVQVMRKYDLAMQNQEAGIIKTRWIDNTKEVNFANSFDGRGGVKASRYKLVVNVVKGFQGTREVTKVTIYMRQLEENDFLQGWKEAISDGIFEKTLLYRVDRLVNIEKRLNAIQRKKEQEELSKIQ